MKITSLQNEKVKYWNSLKIKKVRDKERKFIVEGDHLIKEAKKNNLIKEIISTVDENKDYFVTRDIMKKISNQQSISDEIAICKFLEEKEDLGKKVLLLDRLQDPGNLGTIIRSAVAFNFDTIVLSNDSVDLYNDKVIRASEGQIFNISIIRRNLLSFIPKIKNDNYKVIGTDVTSGKYIKDCDYEKIAIVIGNEGQGMNESTKALCDDYVKIKMNNNCESLNAGVAASILMYEVYDE